MFIQRVLAITILAIVVLSCTDPIDLKMEGGEIQLAVEGRITDQAKTGEDIVPDTVKLTRTNSYAGGPSPVIENALVVMRDNTGNVDTLSYTSDGKYITNPANITGLVGRTYELLVTADGESYRATDELKRVAEIDSLIVDYREKSLYGRAPGYFLELFANDLPGTGDFYRFKVFKNGDLFNRAGDLTLAGDAGFGGNDPIDNVRFVFPIRESLNPRTGATDPETNLDKAPYVAGDKIRVEILSLSAPTYAFFNEVANQASNDGLFASPAANVRTNIININPNSDKKAVGWFYASAIEAVTVLIE